MPRRHIHDAADLATQEESNHDRTLERVDLSTLKLAESTSTSAPAARQAETAASTAWRTRRELVSAGLSPRDVSRPVALLSSRGARAASVPPL